MSAHPFPGTTSVRSRERDFFGSIRRRVLSSIAATVGWVCLVLLFLGFWATGFSLLQSIVVVVVSLLVLAAVLLGAWISFGLQFVGRWD
jgi:membrane-bound ClpP family serine protease